MPTARLRSALPLLALLGCALTPAKPVEPPKPPPALHDRTWELVKIRFGDGNEVKPDAPERYTVRFDQAGRATIQADCNRASGGYTVEGPGLSFSAFATTRAACPPGSLSDRYLMQLGFVRSWGYLGDHLALISLVDGSVLEFR